MEKVICDVCGADYPETAAQCPLCGCARADGGQTSVGNTEEGSAHTYTKGGRFSKSNVRKRLKAAQIQPVPVEMPVRAPEPQDDPDYDDYDDYDEDEVDEEPASNRGLIVIVVLLLLAIIAVSSYIAIVHFDIFGSDKPADPAETTGSHQSTTAPSTDNIGIRIPCTGLTVNGDINLTEKGKTVQLSISTEPLDTTDEITYKSSNEAVATVDEYGYVTAVGDGECKITITCGDFVKECKVTCDLSGNDQPGDPTDPTDPVEPVVELKLNRTDFTLNKKGSYWNVYSGELDPSEITWSSKNENVVTVTNGKVVAVGTGRTQIIAEYKGQVVTCWVSCNWKEETPVEPDEPDQPDTPVEPAEVYYLKVNDLDPLYPTGTNACEVSIKVGESLRLTVVDDLEARMNVTWTASKDGYVSINGNTITGDAKIAGGVTLTATYDGQTFTCLVRVTE